MIRIVRGKSERIDDLQPLWESLSKHHAAVAPHLQELGRHSGGVVADSPRAL